MFPTEPRNSLHKRTVQVETRCAQPAPGCESSPRAKGSVCGWSLLVSLCPGLPDLGF